MAVGSDLSVTEGEGVSEGVYLAVGGSLAGPPK